MKRTTAVCSAQPVDGLPTAWRTRARPIGSAHRPTDCTESCLTARGTGQPWTHLRHRSAPADDDDDDEEARGDGAAATISTPAKPAALPLAHMPEAVRPDGTPLARIGVDRDRQAAESDGESVDSAGSAEAKMADDGTGHHLQGCINQVRSQYPGSAG